MLRQCDLKKTAGSKWVNLWSLNEINEACIWQYIFYGWLKQCWHNIRMGGYLMMMLDYKGGRGVKNLGKSDYILSECS